MTKPRGKCGSMRSNSSGSAFSAAKLAGMYGKREYLTVAWYEHGKPVRFGEVYSSVSRAYERWRAKMAMRGIKVMDFCERGHTPKKVT